MDPMTSYVNETLARFERESPSRARRWRLEWHAREAAALADRRRPLRTRLGLMMIQLGERLAERAAAAPQPLLHRPRA